MRCQVVLLALVQVALVLAMDLDALIKVNTPQDGELEHALSSPMGFVVAFFDGDEPDFSDLESALGGLAQLFKVDTSSKSSAEYLKQLGLDADEVQTFRAYAHNHNGETFVDSDDFEEVVAFIKESIPNDLVAITTPAALNQEMLGTVKDSKLLCLAITKSDVVPDLLVKLSLWLGQQFKVVMLPSPPPEFLQQAGIQKVPTVLVSSPQPGEGGTLNIGLLPFDRAVFGGLKFPNIVKFLLTVRSQAEQAGLLKTLFDSQKKGDKAESSESPPKPSSSGSSLNSKPVFEITSETSDFCTPNMLGLCVIAILDGSPSNPDKEAQVEILAEVQQHKMNQGRALHFMWVDSVCHPSFVETLGVSADMTPTLVAVHPKKKAVAQHLGAFVTEDINTFISSVLTGRGRVAPISQLPTTPAEEDCTSAHQAMEIVEEEDFDLDDIMGESLDDLDDGSANDSDEDEAEAVELSALKAAEEAEFERKKQIAMKEMAKLNSAPKKKSNKKRRRRRSAKVKDEL
eukprot:m.10634 g.10634  ORF g.10634 m.10634 type:complete len:514 (+) comp5596_c0_seq1:71-1612(+)